MIYEVVILCGGKATRMGDICESTPKGLIKVYDKPILEWLTDFFIRKRFKVYLAIGHLANEIKDFYKDYEHDGLIEFCEEGTPLDTGGAIRNALNYVNSSDVLCINGDTFNDYSKIFDAIEFHVLNKSTATQLLTGISNQNQGQVLTSGNRVVASLEANQLASLETVITPRSSSGAYIFSKNLFLTKVPKDEKISLEKSIIPNLISDEKLMFFQLDGETYDVGTPQRLNELKNRFPKDIFINLF
jgi:NDP-sugar pyrophosphorylase family protein